MVEQLQEMLKNVENEYWVNEDSKQSAINSLKQLIERYQQYEQKQNCVSGRSSSGFNKF